MGNYVVIGGNSGIALEAVKKLLPRHRVLTYTRRPGGADGAENILWDVTTPFPGLPEDLESLDGFLYAPGTIRLKPFRQLKDRDFLQDLELNFLGALSPLQESLKRMEKGSVVMFSSVAAQRGMAYHASIAAAKGAVEGFMRAMAAEYAPRGILFNTVALSLTDTPLGAPLLSTPEKRERLAQGHPLSRIGSAEEAADLAVQLLLGRWGWMTGQILRLDGGLGVLRKG